MRLLKIFIVSIFIPFSLMAQDSLNVQLMHHWQDLTLPGSFAFNNVYNEVWGYRQAGKEYAIIGTTAGTHFFDITDASNVQLVQFVPGADQGGVIIHRDYHDYKGLLYAVSDEGSSTLQIMDLTALPTAVPVLYDSDSLFNRVHNIFIDTLNDLLYACSVAKLSPVRVSAMEVYSLANPLDPQLVHTLQNPAIGHVHDAYVRDNQAYLNCGNDGLFIYDFSDPVNPVLDANLSIYPFQGYNHSGWLMEDGKHYVFIDETIETLLKIVNIEDPDNLQVVSTFGTGTHHSSPHNVLIKNCLAYVSYYYDGLRVYNISDPANPYEIAYYDTYADTIGSSPYESVWGVYPFFSGGKVIVSDMQTGLYLFNMNIPGSLPVADFSVQNNAPTFTFNDQSSGAIDHWLWSFGDGNTNDTSASSTHSYSSEGSYDVCLRVSNDAGCSTKCETIEYMVTGIDFPEGSGTIKVYPTQVRDVIYIDADFPVADQLTFEIFDERGVLLEKGLRTVSKDHGHFQIQVNHAPSTGILFLQVSSEKFNKSFKLFRAP